MTGVNAEESVDVDEARGKGEKILASMAGQPVNTYSFKRKDQSITLAAGSSVKIDGVKVCVDPQLLFQRLVFACNSLADLQGVFKYELCSYPAALFDSPVTLRQPQKASLSDALWEKLSEQAKTGPTGQVKYVLDGGALLHPVAKASDLRRAVPKVLPLRAAGTLVGEGTLVVFDGYDHPTTKNMTQQRRSAGTVGANTK